jgi:hypothetical protein
VQEKVDLPQVQKGLCPNQDCEDKVVGGLQTVFVGQGGQQILNMGWCARIESRAGSKVLCNHCEGAF